MLCSAGEGLACAEEAAVCDKVAVVSARTRTASVFIRFLILSNKSCGRPPKLTATSHELLHGTDTAGLTAAALLSRACVVAVAAAVSRKDVRERRSIPNFIGVDAVADCRAVLFRVGEDSDDCTRRDVNYIIDGTPPLRESGQVAREEAETLLAPRRSWWNTRI